jgi:hypothetical protein
MTQSFRDTSNPGKYLAALFNNGVPRANYLCNFSEKNRYLYVETPKVACTTIKRVLQDAEIGVKGATKEANVHDRIASPIKRPADNIVAFDRLINDSSTTIFCFVRNPYTRILSCYLDKIVNNTWERQRLSPQLGLSSDAPPTFLEFLAAVEKQTESERDIHWSSQTYLLRPNRLKYSFIGRFEFFRAQFERVCRHLGILEFSDLSETAHATGANEKMLSYFGEREIEKIQMIYGADFSNFGYGWAPNIV